MQTHLIVALVAIQLASCQHMHLYFRFPAKTGHPGECYDPQVDKFFPVGEEWGLKNANCKLSRCVEDNEILYIDRISCDNVRGRVDLKEVIRRHLRCRIAAGNRRNEFPRCCQQLVCYGTDANGEKYRVDDDDLPLTTTSVEDSIRFA